MAFFVVRYISCLVIFVLGLKAPGIMQNVDYFSLNDSTSDTRLILGVSTLKYLFLFNEIIL